MDGFFGVWWFCSFVILNYWIIKLFCIFGNEENWYEIIFEWYLFDILKIMLSEYLLN